MKYIIAIGDSLTRGYPDGYSWTNIVSTRLGITVENAGIDGDTMEGVGLRLDEHVIKRGPEACIVMAGSNDIFTGFEVDEIKHIAVAIRARLEENNIKPIFGIPIPLLLMNLESKLEEFRLWLRSLGVDVIDFYQALLDENNQVRKGLLPDGIHPDHGGYDLMAGQAETFLKKLL